MHAQHSQDDYHIYYVILIFSVIYLYIYYVSECPCVSDNSERYKEMNLLKKNLHHRNLILNNGMTILSYFYGRFVLF